MIQRSRRMYVRDYKSNENTIYSKRSKSVWVIKTRCDEGRKKCLYYRTSSLPPKCSHLFFFTKGRRERERNSHLGLTVRFSFFSSSCTFTYLHFYTMKEVRENERVGEWISDFLHSHIARYTLRASADVWIEKKKKQQQQKKKRIQWE